MELLESFRSGVAKADESAVLSNSYSKFKDNSPLDTINTIRKILSNFNILAAEFWQSHDFSIVDNYIYSVRLQLNGFRDIGTNGKGTTLQYALASAYGELIERIQAEITFSNLFETKEKEKYLTKFDKIIQREEVNNIHNSFFDKYCKQIGKYSFPNYKFPEFEKNSDLLDFVEENIIQKEDTIILSEFYSFFEKEKVLIPESLLKKIYTGSNGFAAGNTNEEALVQGFSEIFERYCLKEVLLNDLTLPDIPKEYYSEYSEITDIIESYEKRGVEVKLKDASLGQGYPVVMGAFSEISTGKTFINFGSQPNLTIAIERVLTEVSQAGDITEKFKDIPNLNCRINFNKLMYAKQASSNTKAHYNRSKLYQKPDYEFDSKLWSKKYKDNKEMVRDILNFCKDKGYDIYFKDCSFLNFPCFFIYIPQISQLIFDFETERLQEIAINAQNPVLKIIELLKNNEEVQPIYDLASISIFYTMSCVQTSKMMFMLLAVISGCKLKKYNEVSYILDNFSIPNNVELMGLIHMTKSLIYQGSFDKLEICVNKLLEFCEKIELNERETVKSNADFVPKRVKVNIDREYLNLKESFRRVLEVKHDSPIDQIRLREFFENLMKE